MTIGEVAEASGLPAKTIRYYEDIGLIRPPRRDNGYRSYRAQELHKLRFLHRARSLGFTIDECRQLLSLYEDESRASSDVKALAGQHLKEVEAKILELEGMKLTLQTLIRSCRGDHRPDCPILDDLASTKARPDAKRGTGTQQ
ncbi:MAG: Cu(I)-responsive transcriptional regulator [Hyphomicrobiaceae bacterium]